MWRAAPTPPMSQMSVLSAAATHSSTQVFLSAVGVFVSILNAFLVFVNATVILSLLHAQAFCTRFVGNLFVFFRSRIRYLRLTLTLRIM